MSKTRGLGPWVFVAALTAAIVSPGSSRQVASTAAAPASKTKPPGPSLSMSVAADDHIDTLDTIAASLALDTTNDGLRRRALFSLRALAAPGEVVTPQQRNAAAYLDALLRLPLRESAQLPHARTAMGVLDTGYAPRSSPARMSAAIEAAAATIDRFLGTYFDRYPASDKSAGKNDVLLAQDFDQLDKTTLKLAVLRQATVDRGNHVEFLIATLPDPIDSYTGWQFDPMLEAITQAVAAADYVLDRSHFPDSDKEDGAAAESGQLHELEPGVVVFRNVIDLNDASRAAYGDRLVVLLVHENPAAGIHVRALANAIRLVATCRGLTSDRVKPGVSTVPTIRILGPTFSGSSETLSRALRQAEARVTEPFEVRVVSGSATDAQNKTIIEGPAPGPRFNVRFTATVHPDVVMLPEVVRELGRLDWSRQIAVLFEANTQYGRQMGQAFWNNRDQGGGKLSLVSLPFSMNISRLRTTVQSSDATRAGGLGLPSRFRHVDMEAKGNPSDLIPQFSPNTSAAYMELALAATFQTVQRERVKTVALMATDSRDKLFLAQELSRYAPDVSIFTAESDSLYIHPDYSSYLRGAMVVSTYPLHSGNQRWSYGYQGASWGRQFANGSAQGIYNATLALLAYDAQGRPVREDPPRLLEYGYPGEDCASACQPPVWVSVVGTSSAWPLRAYKVDSGDYVFTVAAPGQPGPVAVFPSVSFHVLLTLLSAALVTGLFLQLRHGVQVFAPPAGQKRDRARASLGYLLAGLTPLLVAETFLFALSTMRLAIGDRTGTAVMASVTAAVGLLAGSIVLVRVVIAIGWALPAHAPGTWRRRRSTWAGALAASIVGWSLWSLTGYLTAYGRGERSQELSFLARTLDLGNGVSPALPVLFLCFAFTAWAGTEFARVRRGRIALADAAVHPVIQAMVYGDVRALNGAWALLNRSLISVPWSGIALVIAACAATCIFAFNPLTSALVSTEGPRFGRFVSISLLLVQAMLGLGLVQFGYLWCHVRRLLVQMARHPLAEAYDRVPKDLFPTTIFPRATRLLDLQLAVTHADRVLAESGPDAGGSPAPITPTFEREMRNSPDLHWSASQSWHGLLNAASLCAGRLRPASVATVAAAAPSSATSTLGAVAVATSTATGTAVLQRQAELPAMVAALVVRDALARLAHNLTFVITGILLVFASYTLFPFRQRTNLEMLGWIYIAISFATILTVLVQIKRNPVIASLTTPVGAQKATWDTGFVLKVTVFALLPLFTLFAAQFPDLGGMILRWIEPVQKALP